MRHKLAEREGVRDTFHGTFVRFGWKSGWNQPQQTVLLKNVSDQHGRTVSDHLWFNFTKGFAALDLQEGDRIEFDARVAGYLKGYLGRRDDVLDRPVEEDYKLSHPTKVGVLTRTNRPEGR